MRWMNSFKKSSSLTVLMPTEVKVFFGEIADLRRSVLDSLTQIIECEMSNIGKAFYDTNSVSLSRSSFYKPCSCLAIR